MALALYSETETPFSSSQLGSQDFPEQGHTHASEAYPGELALLRQQSNQLNQIIEVMPTGMVMLDGNGIVIKVNRIASQLLDEPILGQPWFDVIKRSFKPRADDGHEVSLKNGRRVKLEITALGNQPGQLIMITDLTETRIMQDKIAQLQRLSSLGKMVSTLAHQIRTPLSAAMLYGANLKNSNLEPSARENFQDKLMTRLGDLEQQVNDMLLFAKSGSQQVVEPLSVNQIIETSIQGIEPLINKAQACVSIVTCPSDCKILANQTAITGAIENLVNNSLAIIQENAQVTIQASCGDDYAYISVVDNGPGVDATIADKVFEPFYTARKQGTGLGLAVVKAVANAHHGDVQLLSKPGQGAHFCMRIPLINSHANNDTQVAKQTKQPVVGDKL
ncbi:sensor histidine kinase [Thalassotalea sp. PLHSN55]|uniref:sensor histidine kinase n=1 Tax=Thalassotalea sp. PLHSN55 TaxID=3435888 RepID=UPI003F85ED58